MNEWPIESIVVKLQVGPIDDAKIDLVVISRKLAPGLSQSSGKVGGSALPPLGVQERTTAKSVVYWPEITLMTPNRRPLIYNATKKALTAAEEKGARGVGIFTLGLEVTGVPSWEIAEEIVRAVGHHSKEKRSVDRVELVVGSPIQVSSFQYVLNNHTLFT